MSDVTWFKVLTDIFADDKVRILQSMPEGDTLLVMWFKVLAQAGKTNDGGYIYLKKNIPYTNGMLATLFGKQQQLVEFAMRTFSEFGMVDIDDKGYIFVTNWEKHQSIDALEKIKEQDRLRSLSYRERKRLELNDHHVTVTLPSRSNHATELELDIELDKEKDIKPHSRNKQVYDETDTYYSMALYLHSKIMEHAVINKKDHLVKDADLQKWRDEFRKIVEIDKRDINEIGKVIDWCTKDDFWQTNILSAATLRKQYQKLAMKFDSKPFKQNKESKDDILNRRMKEVTEHVANRGYKTFSDN